MDKISLNFIMKFWIFWVLFSHNLKILQHFKNSEDNFVAMLNIVQIMLNIVQIMLNIVQIMLNIVQIMLNSVQIMLNIVQIMLNIVQIMLNIVQIMLNIVQIMRKIYVIFIELCMTILKGNNSNTCNYRIKSEKCKWSIFVVCLFDGV
jgi:hypothetical protein